MKILQCNLSQGWRGGENQTLLLMQALRELGVEASLLARENSDLAIRAKRDKFRTIEISKPYIFNYKLLKAFDIIHSHEVRSLQLAEIVKKIYKYKTVTTRKVDFIPKKNFFTKLKYSTIDAVVPVSSAIKTIMDDFLPKSKNISHVIHDAVKNEISQADISTLSYHNNKKIIGIVAALTGHKDLFTALDVAKIFQNADKNDINFLIFGAGKLDRDLKAYAEKLNLKNLFFEGFKENIMDYYKIFDIFLVTSKEEGLCSSILDAFKNNIPVVATNAGGMPDLIKHKTTGYLGKIKDPISLASGINFFLEKPEERNIITENAHKMFIKDHTIEIMGKKYLEIYKKILS